MTIESLSDLPVIARYLRRIEAEPRTLRKAIVRETLGDYWKDLAIIKFSPSDGTVSAPEGYEPTEMESAEIKRELLSAKFPRCKKVLRLTNLPDVLARAATEDLFEFRDENGEVLMVQLRIETEKGKNYIPYTYYDDDTWRCAEPEGGLPLWGLDKVKGHSTVFIHEGAKGARAIAEMVDAETFEQKEKLKNHPWGVELSNAAHIGWIGGAMSPLRTDWSVLKRIGVNRVYIVSDNDHYGKEAVPRIAREIRLPTFHVEFSDLWPKSFDLGDDFPDYMFAELEGVRRYVGPSFKSCVSPATWATDQIPNQRGRPTVVLREHFKHMWAYVEEADAFVCLEMPHIIRTEPVLNKMLSSFSDTNNTTRLLVRAYTGRHTSICYRPDEPGRVLTTKVGPSINLHMPSDIRVEPGSPKPFLDFMDYMFPNDDERYEMLRWCATLVGHPAMKMEYGVLLVSESTGIGKTTLASSILAPLVGEHNTGWPSENDIVASDFNGWIANKRLVVVNEIYSGHSWKAYHRLKTMITDREIQVNEKYRQPYTAQNWAHIIASSNSLRALKMEGDDRRWFYPEVAETRWPRERFVELRAWLASGGLGVVLGWARGFPDPVLPGERSPMTARKREAIANSRSSAAAEAAAIGEALMQKEESAALCMKDITAFIRQSINGVVHDTDVELRKAMMEAGAKVFSQRLKVNGRMQYVLINDALLREVKNADQRDQSGIVRDNFIKPGDLLAAEF